MFPAQYPISSPSTSLCAPETLRIGLLNDYVHIPYANGSSFASQMLYREFGRDGHEVTVIGPDEPEATAETLPERHLMLPSLPLRNHPGVRLPFPGRDALTAIERRDFDVMIAQTCSGLLELGVWLREKRGIPLICVNTVHLPSVYNVVLPDRLLASPTVREVFERRVVPSLEAETVRVYNSADTLVVLSPGLESYWRDRGVRIPICVIPRAVEPRLFDTEPDSDPFPAAFAKGSRLLVACRHTREKSVDRLLRIFAERIAPVCPAATLTLVGDGPDHGFLQRLAEDLGIRKRCHFSGEEPVTRMVTWYEHSDVFVYASLSETFGQVVGEALWCGCPVVAFADGMGVSGQVNDGVNGYLVPSTIHEDAGDWRFANSVLSLLRNPAKRWRFALTAREFAHAERDPSVVLRRYYEVIESAQRHRTTSPGRALSGRWQLGSTLTRWASVQLLVAASGCLRPPAHMNLEGREQPGWGELGGTPSVRVSNRAALLLGSEGTPVRFEAVPRAPAHPLC